MRTIERIWQSRSLKSVCLLPVSAVFGSLSSLRRFLYRLKLLKQNTAGVPVVVVGNLSVGGTGKSPVIQALSREFAQLGWKPGIVSRGYGGTTQNQPLLLNDNTTADIAGDEPVMHHRYTGVPVCVCTNRAMAAQHLKEQGCTLVLSDDGLQHYAMHRDAEIVVVDLANGFGNGWLLPAGPLRESVKRLRKVDLVLCKQSNEPNASGTAESLIENIQSHCDSVAQFELKPLHFSRASDGTQLPLAEFSGRKVHAVAAIGKPSQFFSLLGALGADVVEHAFDDHHRFSVSDVTFSDQLPIIVTAKDAVKISLPSDAADNVYVLEVAASVNDRLRQYITTISDTLKVHG